MISMPSAYFDLSSGAAGDMLLASFLNASLSKATLLHELKKLKLGKFFLQTKKVQRCGVEATHLSIKFPKQKVLRNLQAINKTISKSKLPNQVKSLAKQIFLTLAKAESKVHGTPLSKVHFHELGAMDTILDIVGFCIAAKLLHIDKFICPPINSGKPAPATLQILRAHKIPFYSNGNFELLTPTAAAILANVCNEFSESSFGNLAGRGAGTLDLKNHPNIVSLYMSTPNLRTSVIETNLDDMSPELFENVCEKLFSAGAKDVWLEPIYMKKFRPGVKLCVICKTPDIDRLSEIIFRETTTFGLRFYETGRKMLQTEKKAIKTKFGKITFKQGKLNGKTISSKPEYDDCKKAAKKFKLPLKEIYKQLAKLNL